MYTYIHTYLRPDIRICVLTFIRRFIHCFQMESCIYFKHAYHPQVIQTYKQTNIHTVHTYINVDARIHAYTHISCQWVRTYIIPSSGLCMYPNLQTYIQAYTRMLYKHTPVCSFTLKVITAIVLYVSIWHMCNQNTCTSIHICLYMYTGFMRLQN